MFIGGFKTTQMLDVIGQVADNQNAMVVNLQVISSFPLTFLGSSEPVIKKKQPKYNPGN